MHFHLIILEHNAINKLRIYLSCLILFILSACGATGTESPAAATRELCGKAQETTTDPTRLPHPQTITVFAAASLTDAFLEMGHEFESDHPDVTVIFSFAGSQVLRTQLEQGAEADVVAFADQQNMDLLISEDLISPKSFHIFTTNHMIVILPADNPAGVQTLADLSRSGMKVVLADSSVPAGNYARQILSKMSMDPIYGADFSSRVISNVVSNETDVRQVVTKVELGEADAGIVYVSDVLAADNLVTITIPTLYNVTAQYPIAILHGSQNPELAAAFIHDIASPAGQAILNEWGFTPQR